MRERRGAARLRQHGRKRCGIEGERSEARRGVPIGRLKPALEFSSRVGWRGGKPAADERRLAADRGVVPNRRRAAALAGCRCRRLEPPRDLLELSRPRQQQRIKTHALCRPGRGGGIGLRRCPRCGARGVAGEPLDRRTRIARARIERLGFDHRRARLARRLAQDIGHQPAVFAVRRQHGKSAEAAFPRKRGLAHDFLPRQETHQKNIVAGQLCRRRKRDDIDLGLAGYRLHRIDLGCEQRAQDQLRAIRNRRARRARGAVRGAARVARDQCQPVIAGREQRHLRRFEHCLAQFGIGARQRQQYRDFDRPSGAWRRRAAGRRATGAGDRRLRWSGGRRYHRAAHAGDQREQQHQSSDR